MSALQRLGNILVGSLLLSLLMLFRRSLRRGESVKYLISDDVIAYIKQHNLYQVLTPTNLMVTIFTSVSYATQSPDEAADTSTNS